MTAKANENVRKHLTINTSVKLAPPGSQSVRITNSNNLFAVLFTQVAKYPEKEYLLLNYLCPSDQRIQNFPCVYLQELPVPKLPTHKFVLFAG